tara:strand:- start:1912 stop:2616 length:705 start_codon:yes stop_codon:yes gene_type:complete
MKIKTDKNIKSLKSNWKFDKSVAKNFDSHVTKSVPLYDVSHDLCISLSEFFLKENGRCYDIGCSNGSLLNKIKVKNAQKKLNLIGIDNSKPMISLAKKKYKNISFKNAHLENFSFLKSDLMLSLYTIQFLRPKYRQGLFNKIYKSLNWGGAFVLFEKIRADDARFQDIMTFLYFDFKSQNGLDSSEILNKEISLRSVLEPYTIQANIDYLKRAGFKDIMPISQYLNFKGFLAIK